MELGAQASSTSGVAADPLGSTVLADNVFGLGGPGLSCHLKSVCALLPPPAAHSSLLLQIPWLFSDEVWVSTVG